MVKEFITNEDLHNNIKDGQKTFRVKKDAILTPLALDLVKKENIELIFDDKFSEQSFNDPCHNKKEDINVAYFTKEIILKFFYLMLKIRLFEELA